MELIVFIVFQLLMEVQSYKSPRVKVSPDVIRESSSVKISCETPADVPVYQCYLYTNREEKNIKTSSSCELDLTGAEVLRWAAVKSPESLNIYCYYTIHERSIDKPSHHSPPATVTVLDSLQKPIISASGDDNLFNIVCEIPLSVRADFICSLYTEDDVLLHQGVSQRSQSGDNLCMFYLSYSKLFPRSVNSRQLICVYSLKTQPEIRSPHSDTYTIRGLPRARLTVSASVILETDTVELSCEKTEDLKMEMCVFIINGRESNTKPSSSCQLSLTGSQISIWSGGQSSSVRITCFFTVMKRHVQKPSAHSDPVTVTVQISTSTITEQTTTTAMKPSLTIMSTSETTSYSKTFSTSTITEQTTTTAMKPSLTIMSTSETTSYSKTYLHSNTNLQTNTERETIYSTATTSQKTSHMDTVISTFKTPVSFKTELSSVSVAFTEGPQTLQYNDIWFIVLVFTGVAVILSGLICLCRYASKKRKRNTTRSVKPDVPSQGIGMSYSGSAEIYSMITSVPATSQPISADVLVHKQQKQGNLEENENVYHLYCTIPDKPVHPDAEDQAYSLVKMHC